MTLNLRANLPVDDSDSHFAYSAGDWSTLQGSTRQYNGSVHTTNVVGATVAFAFQGQAFILFATIPGAVPGNVAVNISIDEGSPTPIMQPTNSSDVFMDPLFTSSIMAFTTHTVVVTNSGNISFMFDEVELFSNDIIPSMSNPPSISSNTTTANSPSSSAQPTAVSGRSKVHTGAIIGGVVGGVAFIIFALLAFLFVRRRTRYRKSQSHIPNDKNPIKPLAAQPFPLDGPSLTSQNYPYPTDSSRPFASAEKAALRAQSSNEERLGNPSALSTPDQSSPSDCHSGVTPTSASDLNLPRPSNATNDVGVETFGHSESATTSSSFYSPSFPRPGEDGPPPYQPLSAARTAGAEHQMGSLIQEESEPGTFG
ncbi:hypothetical protein HYPSUDRAFT_217042 [Hypholoma sublateritium FD-334 SS-4]|uniref:Mid2 domain-containing protein n=1 Tax=Hypholoma sublateritium (strain FD-334 SS-4) TaxID=945553 RepID=A0A0D2L0Z4_HYPSF|nr:hypothetical protein HYPSUDRAFT_217042 [Hypholoma sublateritium FD-334 SS-4]